nr:hypothetical protein [Mucilaginibacter sp. E4BP6]
MLKEEFYLSLPRTPEFFDIVNATKSLSFIGVYNI